MYKTRVLHLIGGTPQGGTGTVVYNYHLHIDKKEIQFDYLIFCEDRIENFENNIKQLGGEVFKYPNLSLNNLNSIKKNLNVFFSVNKNYKIVHIHSPNIAWLVLPILKSNGIKYRIIHSHSNKYSDNRIKSIRNYILCRHIRKTNSIFFACSKEAGKKLFGKKQLNNKNIHIIKNAINLEKFKENTMIRNNLKCDLNIKDELVIGHVGRFSKEKNHTFLIEVFRHINKIQPNSKLMLIGDGELKKSIEKKVIELNLEDKVMFLGNRNDVNNLIQVMDVFILPSLFEGVPIVALEAQAANRRIYLADSISNEVKIIEKVKYLNLKDTHKYWAETILNDLAEDKEKENNEDIISKFKAQGYDITEETRKLQKFYLDLINSK